MQLIKNVVSAGDSATMLVTIHNTGATAAFGAKVHVADLQLGEVLYDNAVDIGASSAVTIAVPWHLALPDTHQVEVVVSPYTFEYEDSYDNNVVRRQLVLGAPLGVTVGGAGHSLFLAAPRPNPSSGSSRLEFMLPARSDVRLEIFDIIGRRIKHWEWNALGAGWHDVDWDQMSDVGVRVAPGLVFCRLEVDGATSRQKLILR